MKSRFDILTFSFAVSILMLLSVGFLLPHTSLVPATSQTAQIDKVLAGELDEFIEAEREL